MSVTDAVCVSPPPAPVTVIVYAPVAVFGATVIVMVEAPDPGAAMDVGLKLTVTPAGWPVALKATAELNPPETAVAIVLVPLDPRATDAAVGEAVMVNAGAITVSETVAVLVTPPPVPVTVTV